MPKTVAIFINHLSLVKAALLLRQYIGMGVKNQIFTLHEIKIVIKTLSTNRPIRAFRARAVHDVHIRFKITSGKILPAKFVINSFVF